MNKRIRAKLEKKADLAHAEQLSQSAWGRIVLSFEHLELAFDEFLQTLSTEVRGIEGAATSLVRERAGAIDRELVPQIERVPLLGPSLARSVHGLASAVA